MAPVINKRRPRTSATMITVDKGGSYTEVIKKARAAINFGDFGIRFLRVRRSITGGLLLEIPGSGSCMAADRL
ncbi:hypothetical protein ALC60_10228, partial [Trachymyrmex zeteki]